MPMPWRPLLLATLLSWAVAPGSADAQTARAAPGAKVPSIDDLLNLRTVSTPRISPDGRWVAYVQTGADWTADAFVPQIWLVDVASGQRRQMTTHPKGASDPRWAPGSDWLAFSSPREDNRAQLYAMRPDGGEALRLTKTDTAIGAYGWSRDGRHIAFTAPDAESKAAKARTETYAAFEHVRRDQVFVHLHTLELTAALQAPQPGRRRTSGQAFSVGSFDWAPDGRHIAFSATLTPELARGDTADLYVVALWDAPAAAAGATDAKDAKDKVTRILSQPGPDTNPLYSPDGTHIAFTSAMGQAREPTRNARIAVVPAAGGTPRSLSDAFDEQPGLLAWASTGIWFAAAQRTAQQLFQLDPASGAIRRASGPDGAMLSAVSLTADSRTAAFVQASATALPEVAVASTTAQAVSSGTAWAARALTAQSTQIGGWNLATRELLQWTSRDGTPIEGVLIKPAGFDPGKRYPLLCIIHGGPTGTDRPALPDRTYYPVDIWAARGALVLKVNYRGSAGYGEAFRRLNIGNLGVGDAWDVISGVDHLVRLGWADPAKVATMGWSQGGYISAFLATSSRRFVAASVGAGISDWATYYYNTDITPFTLHYLGADPVADPAIYAKTSPVAYAKGASTPTLIQHGENDRRVPIANAYQLRQTLEDRGVPVEMVVYKGFGHGVDKPKAQRALMEHNLRWFNHHVFGDPLVWLTAEPDGPGTPGAADKTKAP
jgi:dipeptidyl aminopeptidase/acylaminoacyl peptidase